MMMPGFLYLLLNNYLPMFGIVIAFKNINYVKGIWGSDWVGFKNFEFLFQTRDAYIITRNTLLYNFSFIIINMVCAVMIAILLNEIRSRLAARFYQSFVLLPHLFSAIIISYLAFAFLSADYGYLNHKVLPFFGLHPLNWYNEPKVWPYILVIVNSWKSAGYLSIIYLAAIVGLEKEYYEAAVIDGANKWHQFTRITIPLIAPVIIIMTLLQVGRIFNSDFGLFYQVTMNSGSILETTNVIDTYVYRALMNMGDIGMSSAAGLFQSVVGFVLIFTVNFIVRKISKENALF
ncbi:sugar ABC transporter permease [Paenibacillus marchantiophytorum]|uniref:Sugar ABC transporter permease n=1 Tax=Paenibacillus marchantiophytorum TaxID=1619310 RepID=A0ABQ1F0F0_9BACL|nr:ABC transporter permease subunit [Paenibacillus marchantiophytorum]GFZ94793.1 sugar ABC transporter permease [Paenibacillus marchantiophytorum]